MQPHRLSFVLAACVTFTGTVVATVGEPEPDGLEPATPDEPTVAAVAEVLAAREAGEVRSEYSLEAGEIEDLRELAQLAPDMPLALANGDDTYLNLLASIEDYRFVAAGRRSCATEFAREIERACNVRFEMVVDRRERDQGVIVYSRAVERELALVGGETSDPHCSTYVRCIARVRLGGEVSLGGLPSQQSRFAVAHDLQLVRSAPQMRDVDALEELVRLYEEHLEPTQPTEPLEALKWRRITSWVAYAKQRIAVMEEAAG